MGQSKHEYFHKGTDNQKRPDIVMDLKRPSAEKMAEWSQAEKAGLLNFIDTCQRVFAAFINELNQHTNEQ